MASIKDVAKKAGVSITTVSRVFNNYPDVSEETRKKVLKISAELDYSPNFAARNLSSKSQKNIGLIFSGVSVASRKDNFIQNILAGAAECADSYNIPLSIFLTSPEKQYEKSLELFCRERNLAAVIIQGLRYDDLYFEQAISLSIPVVFIDMQLTNMKENVRNISTDNFVAMTEIVDEFIQRGCKKFEIIAGTKESIVNVERLAGVYHELEKNQIEIERSKIHYCQFSEEDAYKMAKQILSSESLPEAFITFSDLMALGVLRALKEKGISDILVSGFDGIPAIEYINVPLITIKQNVYEMGKQTVLTALELIEKTKKNNSNIYVNHEFVKINF